LFMELATDDGKAAIFLKGVLPKDLAGAFDEAQLAVPPTTPSS
jgi:hypothetical protein